MLKQAFNAVTKLHGRDASLKRLGTPDLTTDCRITPSNYFRNNEGPSSTVIKGREFIVPIDSITTPFPGYLKRGDRIIDPIFGTMTIIEVIEMCDLGGAILGFRLRCE